MVFRLLLLLSIVTFLHAKDDNWYEMIHPKLEVGMYVSNFSGNHSTISNDITSFQNDMDYGQGSSSYFGVNTELDYKYMPDVDVSYTYISQEHNVQLDKTVSIVNYDFNGLITTKIDNEILNVVLKYIVKTKGQRIQILWWKIYPGDMKYTVGLNIKKTDWKIQIIDREDPSATSKFIRVESFMPLPYLGIRYYFYRFSAYCHASAISLGEAKSINYEAGIDFKMIDDLYFSASYIHEYFEATEKEELIKFKTAGNKFSFKYRF